jgi:hypothetical protein
MRQSASGTIGGDVEIEDVAVRSRRAARPLAGETSRRTVATSAGTAAKSLSQDTGSFMARAAQRKPQVVLVEHADVVDAVQAQRDDARCRMPNAKPVYFSAS